MNPRLLRAGALCICLSLAIGAIGLASPARADVSVSVAVPAPYLVLSSDEKAVERTVMLAMLAAFFDVDVDVAVVWGKRYSDADLAVILHLHRSSGRPIGYVHRLRHREHLGWGQIAHRLHVNPGTFNQRRVWAKKQDQSVADGYLWWVIGGYYGMSRSQWAPLRAKGYPPAEVVMAANVAGHAGDSVLAVIRYRAAKHSWSAVGSHFNVPPAKAKKPAPPKKHHPAVKKAKASKASSAGGKAPAAKGKAGKGKGKGKGKS